MRGGYTMCWGMFKSGFRVAQLKVGVGLEDAARAFCAVAACPPHLFRSARLVALVEIPQGFSECEITGLKGPTIAMAPTTSPPASAWLGLWSRDMKQPLLFTLAMSLASMTWPNWFAIGYPTQTIWLRMS